ncbi:MAG: hypothetical protein A6F71_03675 [Cycloclasticus sp. symbiont of Poecilosclerida sp. M]|nr:MAG: hypothetical protein A6F71_03675 [Cycloclasticus sp. symbiont of Poecilosclerida sp. M]
MTNKQKHIPATPKVEDSKRAPISEPTKKSPPAKKAVPAASTKSSSGLSWFAVILSLSIAGLGAFIYINFQQQLGALKQKNEQSVRKYKSASDQAKKDLTEQLQAYEKLSSEKLDLLQEQVGKNKRQWLIAEAEYLASLANSRLRLANDINTAVVALKAADQRLRKNGDPLTFPVREQIAKELSDLASTELPDIIGLSAKIIALEATVGQLKISTLHTEIAKTKKGTKNKVDAQPLPKNIEETLRDAWKNFSKLIVIRRHNQSLSALMAPEQVELIRKSLALKLEGARIALITHDQALYSANLALVAKWIEDYFDTDNAPVNAAINQIKELEKTRITYQLPDISLSLKMLRELPVLKLGNGVTSNSAP